MTTTPKTRDEAMVILGPTASGKTGLALQLAQHVPIEIISVDSALVYRDMDIGTAKPTPTERAAVPHHLIDLIDPSEAYSAMNFADDARRLIRAIRSRGRVPVLVGGTMLYFKALRDGIDALPSADPETRALLDEQARSEGWPALHARLQTLDPITAERLHPTDAQRVQRALEVCLLTGVPMSSLLAQAATRSLDDTPILQTIALLPQTRSLLHQRIAQRFDAMLAQGFLDEVRALKRRPELNLGLPSMRCVGYRQAWLHLDGQSSAQEFRDQGIAATRQLAKRQITWLRGLTQHPGAAGQPAIIDLDPWPQGLERPFESTHEVWQTSLNLAQQLFDRLPKA